MRSSLSSRRWAAFLFAALAWLATPGVVRAQGAHQEVHPTHTETDRELIVGGLSQGAVLWTAVFLAGLAVFAALVWVPARRASGRDKDHNLLFERASWALLAMFVAVGLVHLSLYAVRASGEPFSLGLLWQAFWETRAGEVWFYRLGFAALTAFAVSWASDEGRPYYWWAAAGLGCALLWTMSQLSHAAADGLLPFVADWLHLVAAATWMGGLLTFPLLLLGPLRAMEPDERAELLGALVRRFSRVATVAVVAVVATGLYAALLRVPSLPALVGTPYGRALTMKLGLLVFLLAAGGINLIGRGKGPFGRMVGLELVLATGIFVAAGFLTSVPPADDVWGVTPTNGDENGELALEPVNDSGVQGTASFREITDGVEARLDVSGPPEPGAVYLADIHRGTCYADGGEDDGGTQDGFSTAPERIERPLSPVHLGPGGEGASTTYLFGATFDGLFSGRKPLHIHIAGEGGTPELACSDLSETQKASRTGP